MTAYYNEHDAYAAEWLRNLIAAGHIAPGEVDTRSIEDVTPDELRGFTQCHFFAGVGVWSHALRRAGWPDDREIWTGSCPCQPFSAAGKGKGTADERHLWPAFFHLIDERRPAVVAGEQVASKDGLGWLDLVQADMEGAGYAFRPFDLSAAGFGGAHIRQRLYFVGVGHTNHSIPQQSTWPGAVSSQAQGAGSRGQSHRSSDACRLADADGRDACAERQQCSGEQRQQPQDGGTGGLADSTRNGRREERQDVGRVACGDSAQGLAAGLGAGCGDQRPHAPLLGRHPVDWLYCRDGKWRPVESGTFPLAHAAPARVGRLRAYGNALDAETASSFLEAVIDAIDDRVPMVAPCGLMELIG